MICMVCSVHFTHPLLWFFDSLLYFCVLMCFRNSLAEFIIPIDKYRESVKINYAIGMRFKMKFEAEEATEQRYDFP